MFTVNQIHELLEILNRQNLIFISSKLGLNYLTESEVQTLLQSGINPYHLYKETNDIALMSFHLGMISDVIPHLDTKNLTFDNLKDYFIKGNHIPLTKIELNIIDSIKKQYLGDIRANNGRIFQDLNNIIGKNGKKNRKAYEEVIRDEVAKGILQKKVSFEIARDLARKTGDWGRNFSRIVSYISHEAIEEGRAASIKDRYGDDALVYKTVFEGACSTCINFFLTQGIGSQPIIYKLSKLKANGSNINRKKADWKATLPPVHPWCRCLTHSYNSAYDWNSKTNSFDIPKAKPNLRKDRPGRKPIHINIGDKQYIV